MLQLYLLYWMWCYLLQLKKFYFKCLMSSHCFYKQIDSSTPSSNLSVVSDLMKVGMLAVDIASQDEGSGVQSIDILYQKTSKGDGKFPILFSFFLFLSLFFFPRRLSGYLKVDLQLFCALAFLLAYHCGNPWTKSGFIN